MKKRIYFLMLSAMLVLVLVSCRDKNNGGDDQEVVNKVLMVYMGGDERNISPETYQKIAAIQEGWNGSRGQRVLIYSDPANGVPKLIELVREGDKNVQKVLQTYAEENSASATVFARVISDMKSRYPQAAYNLLMFTHASGWLPARTLISPKSIVIDTGDGTHNEMELVDLAAAIPDNMFQNIIFEACFMSGIEIAYELKDKTKYILASSAEIVSPGFTEIYPKSVNYLMEGKLQEFAQDVMTLVNNYPIGSDFHSATYSIIKTSELGALSSWIKANADLGKTVDVNSYQKFDRYSGYRLFFDFEDYFASLVDTPAQKSELNRLISKAVVWKAATDKFMPGSNGFVIDKHSGLTTYIEQDRFSFMNGRYKDLKWYKAIK